MPNRFLLVAAILFGLALVAVTAWASVFDGLQPRSPELRQLCYPCEPAPARPRPCVPHIRELQTESFACVVVTCGEEVSVRCEMVPIEELGP